MPAPAWILVVMPASLLMRTFAAASPVGSHRNSLASNLAEMEETKPQKKNTGAENFIEILSFEFNSNSMDFTSPDYTKPSVHTSS